MAYYQRGSAQVINWTSHLLAIIHPPTAAGVSKAATSMASGLWAAVPLIKPLPERMDGEVKKHQNYVVRQVEGYRGAPGWPYS